MKMYSRMLSKHRLCLTVTSCLIVYTFLIHPRVILYFNDREANSFREVQETTVISTTTTTLQKSNSKECNNCEHGSLLSRIFGSGRKNINHVTLGNGTLNVIEDIAGGNCAGEGFSLQESNELPEWKKYVGSPELRKQANWTWETPVQNSSDILLEKVRTLMYYHMLDNMNNQQEACADKITESTFNSFISQQSNIPPLLANPSTVPFYTNISSSDWVGTICDIITPSSLYNSHPFTFASTALFLAANPKAQVYMLFTDDSLIPGMNDPNNSGETMDLSSNGPLVREFAFGRLSAKHPGRVFRILMKDGSPEWETLKLKTRRHPEVMCDLVHLQEESCSWNGSEQTNSIWTPPSIKEALKKQNITDPKMKRDNTYVYGRADMPWRERENIIKDDPLYKVRDLVSGRNLVIVTRHDESAVNCVDRYPMTKEERKWLTWEYFRGTERGWKFAVENGYVTPLEQKRFLSREGEGKTFIWKHEQSDTASNFETHSLLAKAPNYEQVKGNPVPPLPKHGTTLIFQNGEPWRIGKFTTLTMILMGYQPNRVSNQLHILYHYAAHPAISRILFLWNGPAEHAPSEDLIHSVKANEFHPKYHVSEVVPGTNGYPKDSAFKKRPVPEDSKSTSTVSHKIFFLQQNANSLNNRYSTDLPILTEAVLYIDDDILLLFKSLDCLFRNWKRSPDVLAGTVTRHFDGNQYHYVPKWAKPRPGSDLSVNFNLVLPRTLIVHEQYLLDYSDPLKSAGLRKYVDQQEAHCDDIALNFLVAYTAAASTYPTNMPKLNEANINDIPVVDMNIDSKLDELNYNRVVRFENGTVRVDNRRGPIAVDVKYYNLPEGEKGLMSQPNRRGLRSECSRWIMAYFGNFQLPAGNINLC